LYLRMTFKRPFLYKMIISHSNSKDPFCVRWLFHIIIRKIFPRYKWSYPLLLFFLFNDRSCVAHLRRQILYFKCFYARSIKWQNLIFRKLFVSFVTCLYNPQPVVIYWNVLQSNFFYVNVLLSGIFLRKCAASQWQNLIFRKLFVSFVTCLYNPQPVVIYCVIHKSSFAMWILQVNTHVSV
jgi:hypothetical protein